MLCNQHTNETTVNRAQYVEASMELFDQRHSLDSFHLLSYFLWNKRGKCMRKCIWFHGSPTKHHNYSYPIRKWFWSYITWGWTAVSHELFMFFGLIFGTLNCFKLIWNLMPNTATGITSANGKPIFISIDRTCQVQQFKHTQKMCL